MNEPLYFLVDLGILPVGADVVLAMTPQVIHPIQLRAALGQPDQLDAHLDGQVLRSPGGINPAKKLVREHEDLVVAGEVSIVTGRGAIPYSVWSGTIGSKESSDGHRVTRWTF